MRIKLMLAGLCTLLLAACGDSKPPEKTVFDPYLQAPKKARAAEQKLQEGAQLLQQQIERDTTNPDK